MNATPRPWKAVTQKSWMLREAREHEVTHIQLPDGRRVLCPDKEVADLILRAVNSYDAMREALEAIANMKVDQNTNHVQLAALCIAIAKQATSQE